MESKTKDESAKPEGNIQETECCKDGCCCWHNEDNASDSCGEKPADDD